MRKGSDAAADAAATAQRAAAQVEAGATRRSRLAQWLLGAVGVLGLAGLAAYAAEQTESSPHAAASPPVTAAGAGSVPGDEVRGPGSYAIGYSLGAEYGNRIRSQGVDLDFDELVEGFKVALNGGQPKLTEAQMQKAVEDLQRRQDALAIAAQAKRQQDNQRFLAENGKKPGVETTSSGLQYEVLKSGDGTNAGPRSLVVTHYEGRLLDGTVFDSSIARRTPAEFRVDGVIKGWQEALQNMREGDKWRLWIPSELAYGSSGARGQIPPDSVLVFEVELIEVKDENDRQGPQSPPTE